MLHLHEIKPPPPRRYFNGLRNSFVREEKQRDMEREERKNKNMGEKLRRVLRINKSINFFIILEFRSQRRKKFANN